MAGRPRGQQEWASKVFFHTAEPCVDHFAHLFSTVSGDTEMQPSFAELLFFPACLPSWKCSPSFAADSTELRLEVKECRMCTSKCCRRSFLHVCLTVVSMRCVCRSFVDEEQRAKVQAFSQPGTVGCGVANEVLSCVLRAIT